MIIKATASSLTGTETPLAASFRKPGALARDMMHDPAASNFMLRSANHGTTPREHQGMRLQEPGDAFSGCHERRLVSAQVPAEIPSGWLTRRTAPAPAVAS